MKVFYYEWPCFGGEAIKRVFRNKGYEVYCFTHPQYDLRQCEELDQAIMAAMSDQGFDFAFSYNFYPSLAECCHREKVKYISVIYDSPFVNLYSFRVSYPTNYVFHFDSAEVLRFNRGGIKNVFHLTLPVDVRGHEEAISRLRAQGMSAGSDVSFVGSLYDEEHNFYDRLSNLDPETRGYLEGVMAAQSKLYGCSIMEDCLSPEIVDKISAVAPYQPHPDSIETLSYIYSEYFLARKLTSMERFRLLELAGREFNVDLYTKNRETTIAGVNNKGVAGYSDLCPLVFADSRINLNITLRSIKNGIPLRCLDIMACGGFLLTNYQGDFEGVFEAGVDYEYFDSPEDMMQKIRYYLAHEEERQQIAANGRKKILENCTIEKVWEIIAENVNINS